MKFDAQKLNNMPGESLRRRITEYFRAAIVSGEIAPGELLPSSQQLSQELHTGIANIQRALAELTCEGLISRHPRRGSVVNDRKKELKTVAIWDFYNPLFPPGKFLRLLMTYLEEEIRIHGLVPKLYLDNSKPFSLNEVTAAYQRREFDAVIFLDMKGEIVEPLRTFTVPHFVMDMLDLNRIKSYSLDDLAEKAVTALAATGRKKAAVISAVVAFDSKGRKTGDLCSRRFYRKLEDGLKEAGMRLAPEHRGYASICNPGADNDDFGWFAYNELKRMWTSPNRPEALFLYSDDCFNGLLAALYELNIRVPEELELVIHHNAERKMICPLKCTYIENSIRLHAHDVVNGMIARYFGHPYKAVRKFEIVPHYPKPNKES